MGGEDALGRYAEKKQQERARKKQQAKEDRKALMRRLNEGTSGPRTASARRRPPQTSAKPAAPVRVVVVPHERPDDLRRLLGDLHAQAKDHSFSVAVYDDCSTHAGYGEIRALLKRRGWEYHRNSRRVGKRGFAEWMAQICRSQLRGGHDHVFFLQDDVRLASRFFERALAVWGRIPSGQRATLQLMRDAGRDGQPCWTGVSPRRLRGVSHTGWVDGLFLAHRSALEVLSAAPPEIDPARWADDPTRSSGFGEHFSKLLHARGRTMFCVSESLLAHVGQASKMNPEARVENPAIALGFVDGERLHDAYRQREPVIASMAAIPARARHLPRVVESLLPQVDRLRVYLNGYSEVPKCLRHPRVDVARSQDHGDKGDAGKFWWIARTQGYVFTVDDDIVYPPDYVATYLRAIEGRKRRAVVATHGRTLKRQLRSYYKDSTVFSFGADLARARTVHVAGTGTTGYHSSTLKLTPQHFSTGFMADVHLAVAAKAQGVPLVVLPHRSDWLSMIKLDDTIYSRFARSDAPQTNLLNSVGPWAEVR